MVYAIVFLVILWVVAGWAFNKTTERLVRRIAILERENVTLAKTVVTLKSVDVGALIAELGASIEGLHQRLLTLENKQQKIAPRPTRVNFRQFRDAAERASEPQEAE